MLEIVDFNPAYGNAFERLNKEWLERYFRVEAVDEMVLGDPVGQVLRPGGAILYAVEGQHVVGTVALKKHAANCYELTKMAVTERYQGAGIGRLLLNAAVRRFGELGGGMLYLESQRKLKPALALYESAGFKHVPRPSPSEYERSDVYMEYRPDPGD